MSFYEHGEPQIDWDELRHFQSAIVERTRLAHVVPVLGIAAIQAGDSWESYHVDVHPDVLLDTARYDYRASSAFGIEFDVASRLTLYSNEDVGMQGDARIYDIDLRPNKEQILARYMHGKIGACGPRTPWISPQGQKFLDEVRGVLAPTKYDYAVIREQLALGASGINSHRRKFKKK